MIRILHQFYPELMSHNMITRFAYMFDRERLFQLSLVFLTAVNPFIMDLFFFLAEDGIRDIGVTGVQTCALPILMPLRKQSGVGVLSTPSLMKKILAPVA